MSIEISAIASVILVSLISLTGAFTLVLNQNFIKKITLFLVSLAAGTLIGDVFIHIIPEMYEQYSQPDQISLMILAGIISFFVLEKILHWTHCHFQISKNHNHPLAINNLVGDALHNFVDGIIIAAGFLAGPEIGIATTIAVILHEIPQEIGDFGVLIHAGLKSQTALFFNFVSGLLAIAGVVFALVLKETSENFTFILLGFAAGGFIYIAIADLLPEIKHEDNLKKSILQLLFVILGIVAMYALTLIEV